MLELFPEGFEEVDARDGVELVAYTDGAGQERFAAVFGAVSGREVPDDWHERWRTFHRGVRIGHLWVGPPWEEPERGSIPVVIDPGRAFGTGSHPTTRLCLELLERVPRGSLLDVGCGSGVVAVAAAKLGFAPVTGLDLDPQAIVAARGNAAANGVQLELRTADVTRAELPAADVAVANITLDVVGALGGRLRSPLAVTSGYLAADAPTLAGFRRVDRREREGWAADLHEAR
ncbi:MAG TPA: 50S ribosomal protein L11 methyltransferase [Gaiellaceae bacterium]|nr:50S ribosomal protein L11 methyltransferase [Gaiellaceae bacterium]